MYSSFSGRIYILGLLVPTLAVTFLAQARSASVSTRSSANVKHKRLTALTPSQLARMVLPSIVRLTVLNDQGQPSVQGSGVVVGNNLIVTNVHVIKNAHAVTANFENGRSETVYGLVTEDTERDLALIYADTTGIKPLPLSLGNDEQIGDSVITAGSPEGLGGSLSTGIISGK